MRLILFFCFLASSSSIFCQSATECRLGIGYVTHLVKAGEYKLASEEAAILNPIDERDADTVLTLKLISSFYEKKISDLVFLSKSLKPEYNLSRSTASILLLLSDSFNLYQEVSKQGTINKFELDFINLYLKKDFEKASDILQQHQAEIKQFDMYRDMISCQLGEKKKSLAKAITLSSILPYSGRFYLNQSADGWTGLLFTSLHAGLAVVSFAHFGVTSIFAWVNTGAATLFYSGGIVGTVGAHKRYSDKLYNESVTTLHGKLYEMLPF